MTLAKTAWLTSAFCLLSVYNCFSQHRPQLWGVAEKGGPQDVGYIFKYDIGSNTLTKMSWLNKPYSESTYYTEIFKADSNYLYSIKTQNDSVDKATIVRYNLQTNQLEKLYTFDPYFYIGVSGALSLYNGKYYGLAWGGRKTQYEASSGIIFEYDPNTNAVTNKHYFGLLPAGTYPRGQLFLHNNKFYGTTSYGGATNGGTFFEFDPATNVMVKKGEFVQAVTGQLPVGFLTLHNGKLFGACLQGGTNDNGTLFEYNLTTGALSKVIDFADDKPLEGKMTLVNDKLYSAVPHAAMIMEFDLLQKTRAVHRPLLDGKYTVAYSSPLTLHNGVLYGTMADHWGKPDSTTVYSWTPGSTVINKIARFHITNAGKDLRGPLAFIKDKWYGITEKGSVYGRGGIVEIDPVAKNVAVKASFGTGIDGYSEFNYSSNLLPMNKRFFYGTTEKGGLYDFGFLYSFDPYTKKTKRIHDFTIDKPSLPYGNLTSPGDREMFGITINGPDQAYGNGWYYHYLIPDNKFEFIAELGEFNPMDYYNGAYNPYMAYSYRLYKATEDGNGQQGGIFMCYPGNNPDWTRVFTFPDNITPANEKGQVEINNQLLGLGYYNDGNGRQLIVYKLDLVNYNFTYRFLANSFMANPVAFRGHPVELNNKYYVLSATGCFQAGSLIEWDNAADTVIEYCMENRFTDGKVTGSLTVVDGKLYGFAEKAIVCFDPVAKTFKTVYKSPTPLCADFLETYKKLTFAISNELPHIGNINTINICLDDSLQRNQSFAATDPDADILDVKAAYTDSVLIRNCSVRIDSSGGKRQYTLHIEIANKTGNATIIISAADTFGGFVEIPVSLVVGNRPDVTLASIDTLCKNDSAIALTGGLPAGGVYKIDGVIADSLRPASLTEGTHTLKYIFPASGACQDSASRSFYVTECADPNPAVPGTLKPYPNPSPGPVKIDNEDMLSTTVQVFNSQGYKVYSKVSADKIIELDLSGLQTGMYYITATNSKGTATGKVEIVH